MLADKLILNEDAGKLVIRITVGSLMLFHGIHKLIFGHDFIVFLLQKHSWPTVAAYGVPLGEVVAPLLLIGGVLVREAALVMIFTMVIAIYLFYGSQAFTLDQYGALTSQLNLFFIGGALAVFFLGEGRYSLSHWFKRKRVAIA